MTDEVDPLFDEFVRATRSELDRRLDESAPLPDFAAMFQRAHELDPELVDEETLAHVCSLAPVVPLRARANEQADELAPFTTALRGQLEAGVAERRTREIPAPSFVHPRRLTRRRGLSWVAAAIVLVLFGGVVSATIGGGDLLRSDTPSHRLVDAIESLRFDTEPHEQPELDEQETIAFVPPASLEEPEPEPELAQLDGHTEPPAPVPPRKRKRSERDSDELAELDARAQALWRAGDLDGAEQLFREIVRRGGQGRWAQLAYGELFSLAQRHPGEQREALWRDYLATFPKGRYAEDARAGLCRRAPGSERDACWSDYISRHPEGTHAEEARRALGLDAAPP